MKLKTGNKKLNQTKSWLFEKNSNIDSFLANAIKKKKKQKHKLLISDMKEGSSLLITWILKV